jgi:hypothetical protein
MESLLPCPNSRETSINGEIINLILSKGLCHFNIPSTLTVGEMEVPTNKGARLDFELLDRRKMDLLLRKGLDLFIYFFIFDNCSILSYSCLS